MALREVLTPRPSAAPPSKLSDEAWDEIEELMGAALTPHSRAAIENARDTYCRQAYFNDVDKSHKQALHRDDGLAKAYRTQLRKLLAVWDEAYGDAAARGLLIEAGDAVKVITHGRVDLVETMVQLKF